MHQQKRKQRPKSRPIDPIWQGETVTVVASGPSLLAGDVNHVKDKSRVIVVNDNYQVAPWADAHYACDAKWYAWHWQKLREQFNGIKYTQCQASAVNYNLRYIESKAGQGLSTDPATINTGCNSGHQAVNLAYHLGAAQILLLGFDMKFAKSGAAHWFGDHPDNVRSNYKPWIEAMNMVAKQNLIEIINCSRDTAIECFPRQPITEALP